MKGSIFTCDECGKEYKSKSDEYPPNWCYCSCLAIYEYIPEAERSPTSQQFFTADTSAIWCSRECLYIWLGKQLELKNGLGEILANTLKEIQK